MADDEIREEEESEVEGHVRAPDTVRENVEGTRPAHDDDSDDVEAHLFKDKAKDAHIQKHRD